MVAAAAAGAAFHGVFGYGPLLLPVAVAAAVPATLSCLLRRASLEATCVVSAVLWLMTSSVTLRMGEPVVAGLTGTLDGAVNGWARLLSVSIPAPVRPDLLTVPVTATWLASAFGAEIALRTRMTFAIFVPPLAELTGAVAVSVPATVSVVPEACLLTLTALLTTAALRTGRGKRRLLDAFTVIGVLAAALVLVSSLLRHPSWQAYDPRAQVHAPSVPATTPDLLALVAAWRRQSPIPSLFEASEPARWRLGVLTGFDGVRWTSDSVFRVGGPTITMPAPDGSPLHEDVRILGLTGQLLPIAEQPARLAGEGLAADATTGLALHAQGLEQGYRYGLDAVRTRLPTPAQQPAQRVSRDDPRLTKLPLGVPPSLRDFAESTTEGAATPYEKATALARGLRRNSVYVPTAENDASYGAVGRFLTQRRGSATAFAVTFVLAARVLHLPARVVVGFTAGKQQPGAGYVVRGSNATAWGEVKFEHLGWVAFNPLPAPSTAVPDEGSTTSPSPRPATASPTPSPTASPPRATPTGPTRTGIHRGAHRPSVIEVPWLQLFGAVVALALAYRVIFILFVPLIVRRRRQRIEIPSRKVAAAWRTCLEELEHLDVRIPPWADHARTAAIFGQVGGTATLAAAEPLSRLTSQARFGEPGPSAAPASGWPRLTDEHAERAWNHAEVIRRELRARAVWHQKPIGRLLPACVGRWLWRTAERAMRSARSALTGRRP
ncbi:transglutaminase domain-containing protein [Streptomyces sp. NPDC059215]|uniref:transglutaminase domain-containing protein n=1 Tax=unclassified Streptomyces TaxID=2593676 RepID=UPI00368A60AB